MRPSPKKSSRKLRRNQAAVDSELAWLPLSQMQFPLTGAFPNWLYGATNTASFNPTNGLLIIARLDGPTAEIANGPRGQSSSGRARRLVGTRLF